MNIIHIKKLQIKLCWRVIKLNIDDIKKIAFESIFLLLTLYLIRKGGFHECIVNYIVL